MKMKTIRHSIEQVMWPYAFLLNNHKTFRGFKEHLKGIFSDYDDVGVDEDEPEEIKELKSLEREINKEALRFYELRKTLPYKIDVVLSNEFCSFFADIKKRGGVTYNIYPHTPYQINRTEHSFTINNFQGFLDYFVDLHPEINPFEIHINKASFLDILLKEMRIEEAAKTEVFLSRIGSKLKYRF